MKIFSNGGKIGFTGQHNIVLKEFEVTECGFTTDRPTQDIEYGGFKQAQFQTGRSTVTMTITLKAPAENMKVFNKNDENSIRKEVFCVPDHIPDSQIARYANRIAIR